MLVDLPDTLKIVVVCSDDEPMEGFEGHLEAKDDPEEDQEIDEWSSKWIRRLMR